MAIAGRSSASFKSQLEAAFQQIRILQAENLRLQSTSFRLEAALQQYINENLGTSIHPEQPKAAGLCTHHDSCNSMQQTMFVVGADTQYHTTTEGTQRVEDTTSLDRPSLDLLSSPSSSESVSFIPVVAFTQTEKAPELPDRKFKVVSAQAHTDEPQAADAAALLATVPSPTPLQHPNPVAAVLGVSPFAAYSHRAFSDCSSADRCRPADPALSNKALLSFGSDNSTAGGLLTGLSVTPARHVDDASSLLGTVGSPSRCDYDKLCHSLSSSISASSLLVDDSTDCSPGAVCVVQQQKGMGCYTLVVGPEGDNRIPQKHGVLRKFGNALGMCFCSSAGSAL